MNIARQIAIVVISVCAMIANTKAGTFQRGDGLTLVWVTIETRPNEEPWEACRKVYQRDVYQVRRGPEFTVRCNIDHSRIYDYGERQQNFNRLER